MKDLPEGVGEAEVRTALTAWGLAAASLTYAPVGFGDYHWVAAEPGSTGRWFVTVADLAHKRHCGDGPAAAFRGLRRAMETARVLRDGRPAAAGPGGAEAEERTAEPARDFVVAPLRAADGETVRGIGERYAVSVFPFVDGDGGDFGDALPPHRRARVLEALADLHRATPPAVTPVLSPDLPDRDRLARDLAETDRPWTGGPFSEPAGELLAAVAPRLSRLLEEFAHRAAEIGEWSDGFVVTHGEPHPGNLLWRGERCMLVDWDTASLAPPERDLWLVGADPDELAAYARATGRRPDRTVMEFYRLRWALADVAEFIRLFRSPHDRTPDTEVAWRGLTDTVDHLTRGEAF